MAGGQRRVYSARRPRPIFYAAFLLALFALLTVGATLVVVVRGAGADLLRLLLPATIYCAFALALTRDLGLAAVVGLAPFAGAIWCLALGIQFDQERRALNLAMALAAVLSFICVDEFEAQIASEANASVAAIAGLRALLGPAGASLVPFAAALALAVDASRSGATFLSSLGQVLPALGALILVPAGSMLVRLDEPFIARVNRAREWRVHAAYFLTLTTVPRWGLSLSGIGLVIGVVACFGAEPLGWVPLAIVVATLPASFALVRDWRTAIGLGFALSLTVLMGLWAGGLEGRTRFNPSDLYQALAISLAMTLGMAVRAVPSPDMSTTLAHAIEQRTAMVLCATGSVLLALLTTVRVDAAALTVVAAGAVSALVLVPAVVTALETLLPRKRSVAELYGQRS